MKEFKLMATEDMKHPKHRKDVNWIAWQVYEATDDGEALRLNSETGWFTFSGFAREWMLGEFREV